MAVTTNTGKKKPNPWKKLALEQKAILDKLAITPATGSGVTPGMLFAQVKDPQLEKQGGFEHERDFYLAVLNEGLGNANEGERKRLEPLRVKTWQRKAAGSDEGAVITNPYGGFLVPPGFLPQFLKITPEQDPIGAATRKIPMAVPIVKIPARVDTDHRTSVAGGITVTRRPETVAGTPSRMEVSQVSLEAHELFGLAYATEQLLTYSAVSFAAILADGFDEQFQYALLKERLYGTGVGEFLGVLNAGNNALVSVAKETNQAAATIVYANVLKMYAQCWGYEKALWLVNHDCMPQLMLLNQTIGVGGVPVWQPSAREGEPPTLLGRPIVRSEYAKTLGTLGDISLVNWGEYLEGNLQGMQTAESIHVRFVNNERTFRWFILNAGLPWWKTTLTPINSSNAMSPYVALATRA